MNRATRLFAVAAVVAVLVVGSASPVAAADAPTMEAHILLGGHARLGSWLAISVRLRNSGPTISGEVRLAGGTQGQTRFGLPVELPPDSDKTIVLYAQPPAFGTELEVQLVQAGKTILSSKAKFAIHDASQLVVAVIAEHPERIVGSLNLPPNLNQVVPLVLGLAPEELPERVEAWASIDRIVWQDVDSSRLSDHQFDALRGWVAGGGRLVLAGGTIGPRALSAFPDLLLPFRPVATIDVPATSLSGVLGQIPDGATSVPALSGELISGRALASVGDRVVAADRGYGSGSVTLLGFDPTVDWIAKSDASQSLWRQLLPARTFGGLSFFDDNLLVGAVSQLPALALPPVSGLLALLAGYILLIGPVNYLVLRRLDRREWAWVTMPALIVVFAVGAYGFGAALRGSDLIINEVAIVRGSPGTTDGAAQAYLGIFSPSRGVYQVRVPGGALLSSPINGDGLGGGGSAGTLDVMQGDPSRVRDLAVGFGALRTIRAETPVPVPLIQVELRLAEGRLVGQVTNASDQGLEHPAVVLGSTVALLPDLEPGATAKVDVAIEVGSRFQDGRSLADRIIGPISYDGGSSTIDQVRLSARHSMIDQLTWDPNFGTTNLLASEGPVLIAWGSTNLIPVEIESQVPRHLGSVLYYLPTEMTISGLTTFRSDLVRSTIVATDSLFFNKDPSSLNFGRGSATVAYRPVAFAGRLDATELSIGLNVWEPGLPTDPDPLEPLASIPPPCTEPATPDCNTTNFDGIPEVELFDVRAQVWRRFPHLSSSSRYTIAEPASYVDPATGTVLIRFVNDAAESVGFGVDLVITGTVR